MQVAIITGAGSGIGFATAKMLHEAGMAIVGVGRDKAKLAALEAAINDPARCVTISADLTAKEAPQQIVALALEKFGRIDFLINNAGIGSPKPLHETDDDTLDQFLDIMLRAPFRLARDVIVHMKAGSGIVNVVEINALMRLIYDKKVATPPLCDEMISILKNCADTTTIPRNLPKNLVIAHKTGGLPYVRGDVAIIYTSKPFIISIFIEGFQDVNAAEQAIGDLAKICWEGLK